MISRILLWVVFLCIPWVAFHFKGVEWGLISGIGIVILLQVFAMEEIRDIRERQIKFIESVCKKFKIENKE